MRIGIIGAGHIGGTLAKLFVDAGRGVERRSGGPADFEFVSDALG